MAILNIKKVTAYPGTLAANTIYIKRSTAGSLLRLGATDSSGVLVLEETLFNTPLVTATSGVISIDMAENIDFLVNLTGNATINFSTNPAATVTAKYVIRIKQDSTGGRTVLWNTAGIAVTWQDGVPPIIADAPNEVTLISLFWDGTSYFGVKSCGFQL